MTPASGFSPIDAIVLLSYLIGTTLLGVWLGRNQRNARDYFVAGRKVPWWAILFSVVATETSALTFISIPGVAYLGHLGYLQIALGYLIGRTVVAFVLLPRYYEGELVTAYAMLETRFGLATRRFASIVFMVTRAFGDSVRVFATAIPLGLIIGPVVPAEYLGPVAILILGTFTVIYTYHGGMRAVIWTDVIQMCIYVSGGLLALALIGGAVPGGWGAIIERAGDAGKLRVFDPYLGFDRAQTALAGMIGGAFLSMASHGADQLIVQRLLAAPTLKDSRKVLIGSGIAVFFQFGLFLLVGTGLWAYYEARAFDVPDAIFPTFIVEVMPVGLTGLVIAAILAAAMSTISSSLNSLSAASLHDVYLPLTRKHYDEDAKLKLAKRATLVWAVVLIGGALMYRQQGRPVVDVALAIASFTYGGLLGTFFLAILWPRAKERDAILGMALGIGTMTFVVFGRLISRAIPALAPTLEPLTRIAWPWYVLIGTTITLTIGIISSSIRSRST